MRPISTRIKCKTHISNRTQFSQHPLLPHFHCHHRPNALQQEGDQDQNQEEDNPVTLPEDDSLSTDPFLSSPTDLLSEFEEINQVTNFTEDLPTHKAGFITIIGRPNAGKSTLMNALINQPLSIVTAKAQTTRHRILGILSEPSYQAIFLDTPGIMDDARNELDERMMESVKVAVSDADALLAIVDATKNPVNELAMIKPGKEWSGPPLAILLNKIDALGGTGSGSGGGEKVEELVHWYRDNAGCSTTNNNNNNNSDDSDSDRITVIAISALERQGLDQVSRWVEKHLPLGQSLYPKEFVSEASERFFVSEILRKHIFLHYQQEIPYSVAVEVADFKERKGNKCYISVNIFVEHDRQKGIIIGKGGLALKNLASEARVEIEEFLGRKVYMEVKVKVAEGWRKDPQQLERLGYHHK